MKRIRSLSASRWVRLTTPLCVVLVPVGILLVGSMRTSGSEQSTARLAGSLVANAPGAVAGRDLDPQRVEGSRACVECHKSEYAAWMETVHYGNDERLRTQAAADYAEKLGISQNDLTTNSLCVECHGTVKQTDGSRELISGVSCESCHGASGGENGWLNRHAVYGNQEGATREQETEQHFQNRVDYCEKAGMVRAANVYEIAKNCYGCHIVGNEDLVGAGHKAGSTGFELVGWSSGEVRHNFHLDQDTNAEAPTLWMERQDATAKQRDRLKFVAGVLAELEVAFRNRATAKTPAYASQMGARIAPLQAKLATINGVAPSPEIQKVTAALGKVFPRLFAPQPGDEKAFNDAADTVAEAAKTYLENHDGSKLQGLDGMIQGSQPKGEVYQP